MTEKEKIKLENLRKRKKELLNEIAKLRKIEYPFNLVTSNGRIHKSQDYKSYSFKWWISGALHHHYNFTVYYKNIILYQFFKHDTYLDSSLHLYPNKKWVEHTPEWKEYEKRVYNDFIKKAKVMMRRIKLNEKQHNV